MNNYLILHGSFSSPLENWFPYLKREIKKLDYKVAVPHMPIGVNIQNYDSWSREIDKFVNNGFINENTIIFAHSIAPVFTCQYLIENRIKVKKLIFVSGFNNFFAANKEFDNVNASMFCNNIAQIKKYCQYIFCLYSDNEPYIPYDKEKEFADSITKNQIIIKNGGHLNSESGYTQFPELIQFI